MRATTIKTWAAIWIAARFIIPPLIVGILITLVVQSAHFKIGGKTFNGEAYSAWKDSAASDSTTDNYFVVLGTTSATLLIISITLLGISAQDSRLPQFRKEAEPELRLAYTLFRKMTSFWLRDSASLIALLFLFPFLLSALTLLHWPRALSFSISSTAFAVVALIVNHYFSAFLDDVLKDVATWETSKAERVAQFEETSYAIALKLLRYVDGAPCDFGTRHMIRALAKRQITHSANEARVIRSLGRASQIFALVGMQTVRGAHRLSFNLSIGVGIAALLVAFVPAFWIISSEAIISIVCGIAYTLYVSLSLVSQFANKATVEAILHHDDADQEAFLYLAFAGREPAIISSKLSDSPIPIFLYATKPWRGVTAFRVATTGAPLHLEKLTPQVTITAADTENVFLIEYQGVASDLLGIPMARLTTTDDEWEPNVILSYRIDPTPLIERPYPGPIPLAIVSKLVPE